MTAIKTCLCGQPCFGIDEHCLSCRPTSNGFSFPSYPSLFPGQQADSRPKDFLSFIPVTTPSSAGAAPVSPFSPQPSSLFGQHTKSGIAEQKQQQQHPNPGKCQPIKQQTSGGFQNPRPDNPFSTRTTEQRVQKLEQQMQELRRQQEAMQQDMQTLKPTRPRLDDKNSDSKSILGTVPTPARNEGQNTSSSEERSDLPPPDDSNAESRKRKRAVSYERKRPAPNPANTPTANTVHEVASDTQALRDIREKNFSGLKDPCQWCKGQHPSDLCGVLDEVCSHFIQGAAIHDPEEYCKKCIDNPTLSTYAKWHRTWQHDWKAWYDHPECDSIPYGDFENWRKPYPTHVLPWTPPSSKIMYQRMNKRKSTAAKMGDLISES